MKSPVSVFFFLAIVASSLQAETPFEREYKLLRDQRDKAIAAAIDPINRRHQASLDQLLRRATQGNDLETALKIKQELGAAAASVAVTPQPTAQTTGNKIKTKREIEKYLTNTSWDVVQTKSKSPWGSLTFKEKGVLSFQKDRKWSVTTNGKVLLEQFQVEFSADMKAFTVVWGASGELTATLKLDGQ